MKVALIEVGHWHFPLYQAALRQGGIEIVGVSDRDRACRERVATSFQSSCFADWRELVASRDIDFAFAFGRHSEMPHMAEALIARRIPFALEKPCGVNPGQVSRLRKIAEDRDHYVAVPFVLRISPLLDLIRALEGALPTTVAHVSFRQISGPPSRYVENGCAWMLEPSLSGGGCTINLAVHFIDLVRVLTGSEAQRVCAHMNNRNYGTAVEDYSQLTLTTANGCPAVIETGYGFPTTASEKREFSFSLSSSAHYVRSSEGGVRAYSRAAHQRTDHAVELDMDGFYAVFVERALADFRAGRPPVAGLADAEAAMKVVDAGYLSDRSGDCVTID